MSAYLEQYAEQNKPNRLGIVLIRLVLVVLVAMAAFGIYHGYQTFQRGNVPQAHIGG